MMALIGSIIIDQVIFKDDIELEKEQFINNKVEKIYPSRAGIRQKQIDQLKVQLFEKDSQRTALNNDIQAKPVINTVTTQISPVPVTVSETDPVTGNIKIQTKYENKPTTVRSQIPNPNIALIAPLDSQINSLQRMILSQGDSLSNLRISIEKLLKEKTGFLDELNIMFSLLGRFNPGLSSLYYLVFTIPRFGIFYFL